MNVVIKASDINRTDFRSASEIWVAPLNEALAPEDTEQSLCLWRGEPVVTHDMLSEGTHEQNIRRWWVPVSDIDDQQAVQTVEHALRQRLQEQQLDGEFYPAQRTEQFQDGDAERTPQ
jgi:hypothetical protein